MFMNKILQTETTRCKKKMFWNILAEPMLLDFTIYHFCPLSHENDKMEKA